MRRPGESMDDYLLWLNCMINMYRIAYIIYLSVGYASYYNSRAHNSHFDIAYLTYTMHSYFGNCEKVWVMSGKVWVMSGKVWVT